MITDVVSGGCSFVWGEELENRDDRFVKIISDKLNANLHDISFPGRTNQLICTDIIDKLLDLIHNQKISTEKIFVIVNWSFLDRLPYYNAKTDKIETIRFFKNNESSSNIKKSNYYYDHENINYLKYHFFNLLHYLQMFLKANNIKYIFAFADDTVHDLLKLKQDKIYKKEKEGAHRTSIENILKTIDTKYFYLDLNISCYKKLGFKLAPEKHPLEDAHAVFAEKLIDFKLEIVDDN